MKNEARAGPDEGAAASDAGLLFNVLTRVNPMVLKIPPLLGHSPTEIKASA